MKGPRDGDAEQKRDGLSASWGSGYALEGAQGVPRKSSGFLMG